LTFSVEYPEDHHLKNRSMHRPLIHIICGSTGAGKTTYAVKVATRLTAVRFSIDEWMSTLFWMDSPQPLEAHWSLERVDRCIEQIWSTAVQVARCGTPCVLDLGFSSRESRESLYDRARSAGLSVQLHLVDAPAEERWRRVETRNSGKGATHQLPFAVTREMFDFVETLWEAPGEEEMAAHDGVRV
jgi:predicted kinase